MPMPSRNAPCPCGSGKKYKLCCLPKLQPAPSRQSARVPSTSRAPLDEDDLDQWSNAVVDLIHAGRLDEAEVAARDLMRRFPDDIDGLERLGHVYEARGDKAQAASHYRQAVALARRTTGLDEHTRHLLSLA
ncbi:MAG: SEC-C metal-binding domain-containing protein, partial [Actinomycetota bacterium]|nr:SEC-C metal-binding domain-containing protein [Actinomycetota bacterium]